MKRQTRSLTKKRSTKRRSSTKKRSTKRRSSTKKTKRRSSTKKDVESHKKADLVLKDLRHPKSKIVLIIY